MELDLKTICPVAYWQGPLAYARRATELLAANGVKADIYKVGRQYRVAVFDAPRSAVNTVNAIVNS